VQTPEERRTRDREYRRARRRWNLLDVLIDNARTSVRYLRWKGVISEDEAQVRFRFIETHMPRVGTDLVRIVGLGARVWNPKIVPVTVASVGKPSRSGVPLSASDRMVLRVVNQPGPRGPILRQHAPILRDSREVSLR
jgi:hypothetical protein